MKRIALLVAAVTLGLLASMTRAAERPLVEKYLLEGKFADGDKALTERLQVNPKDDQARFGLGVLRVVRSFERWGRSLYGYGIRTQDDTKVHIPILSLYVPKHPKPQRIDYAAARKILQDLINDLTSAEAVLAEIRDDEVKLSLKMGLVELDLTGDGSASVKFRDMLSALVPGGRNVPMSPDWAVTFDRGDVAWFRGYCHLLMAITEFALAHDCKELFECTAHLFFTNPNVPHQFLLGDEKGEILGYELLIVDGISLIHLIRLPVTEPHRLKETLSHLQQMLALSRESWKHILAEQDNDKEWLPNPKQQGVFNVAVRQAMIDRWLEMVSESEALLAGKKLVPFWRGGGKRGINLQRALTEAKTFDLVLWVQGTAATPYLEEGTLTDRQVWERLLKVFQGDFAGFAVWFN